MRVCLLVLTTLLFAPNAFAQRDREIKWVNPDVPNVQGLEHKVLASKLMGHDVGYVVWTPPEFDKSGSIQYPVVYFLHGAGGSEASDAGGFASRLSAAIRQNNFPPAICVFPNGGMSGYRGDVEQMIVNELIPLIDADYSTKAEASSRAIAGFSMGGAGAVSLAIRHPKLFCVAGSWGGALSWRGKGEDSPLLPAAVKNAAELRRNGFSLLTVNGDQDRPDGFTPLRQTLQSVGVAHETVILDDTSHNLGMYYEQAGDRLLAFLAQGLHGNPATSEQSAKRTIRVLTIGNSFAGNACKYLKEIANDRDIEIVIGTANLGGCTLERHASLAKQSAVDPSNRPYPGKSRSVNAGLSLQEYLRAQPWDYVTIQQMSALSHQSETYHPFTGELVALINELAPKAELLIHQTWAYRADAPLLKEWGITQGQMHERLSDAYASVAKQFSAKVIPVGSAFQRVRSTPGREVVVPDPNYNFENPVHPQRPNQRNSLVAGWYWDKRNEKPKLRLDFKHANVSGCYLAGLVWYETITGNDARDITYTPAGVSDIDASLFRNVAHGVVSDLSHGERREP